MRPQWNNTLWKSGLSFLCQKLILPWNEIKLSCYIIITTLQSASGLKAVRGKNNSCPWILHHRVSPTAKVLTFFNYLLVISASWYLRLSWIEKKGKLYLKFSGTYPVILAKIRSPIYWINPESWESHSPLITQDSFSEILDVVKFPILAPFSGKTILSVFLRILRFSVSTSAIKRGARLRKTQWFRGNYRKS